VLEDNWDKFAGEDVYAIVRGVYDAEALVLMRQGQGEASVDTVMKETERRFNVMKMAVRQAGEGEGESGMFGEGEGGSVVAAQRSPVRRDEATRKAEEDVRESLRVGIKMCEELGAEGEGCWFLILDRLLNLKGIIMITNEAPQNVWIMKSVYGGLMKLLMSHVVENVGSGVLVGKLCEAGNRLGEFRDVLRGILEGYKGDVEVCRVVEGVVALEERKMAELKLGGMKRGERVREWGGGGGGGGRGGGEGRPDLGRRRKGVKNSWLRPRNGGFDMEGSKRKKAGGVGGGAGGGKVSSELKAGSLFVGNM